MDAERHRGGEAEAGTPALADRRKLPLYRLGGGQGIGRGREKRKDRVIVHRYDAAARAN